MWEIFVLGDAGFIGSIMNALAMLANANIFLQLAAVGLLLGVIITVGQGLADSGRINVGPLLGSLILVLIMFSQTTNVTIINVRTGGAQIVSNVPFGPVVIGSLVSRMGKSVTETLELAFSTPGMSEFGYFTPIKALAKMREMIKDSSLMDVNTDPTANGSDLQFSVTNYVKDCTANKLERNEITFAQIMTSKTPLDALRWDSLLSTTVIQVAGVRETINCTLAYVKLEPLIEGAWSNKIQETITGMIRSSNDEYATGGSLGGNILNYAADRISNGAYNAGPLVVSSTLNRMLELGLLNRLETDRMWVKAATEREAINKRIESWQAEASVFEHFMIPIMTFLEGLCYAIAPFAALAIGLGAKGIKVAGTYITLAIWVQLWMPLMSIVNHFTTEIAMGSLSSIGTLTSTSGFPSFASLNSIDSNLQTWLAVAGMLSSSVPFLAAAVLFGGGQLIGKMGSMVSGSGAAGGSAGISAPAIMKQMPAINSTGGSVSESSGEQGNRSARSAGFITSMNLQNVAARSAASSEGVMNKASEDYATSVGNALNTESASQTVGSKFRAMSVQQASTASKSSAFAQKFTDQIAAKAGLTAQEAGVVRGAIGANLGNIMKGSPINIGGNAEMQLGKTRSEEISRAAQEIQSSDKSLTTQARQAVAADIGAKSENSVKLALGERNTNDAKASWSNYQEAKSDYNEQKSAAASFTGAASTDNLAFAQRQREQGNESKALKQIDKIMGEQGLTGQFEQQVAKFNQGVLGGNDKGLAKMAVFGSWATGASSGDRSETQQAAIERGLGEQYKDIFGTNTVQGTDVQTMNGDGLRAAVAENNSGAGNRVASAANETAKVGSRDTSQNQLGVLSGNIDLAQQAVEDALVGNGADMPGFGKDANGNEILTMPNRDNVNVTGMLAEAQEVKNNSQSGLELITTAENIVETVTSKAGDIASNSPVAVTAQKIGDYLSQEQENGKSRGENWFDATVEAGQYLPPVYFANKAAEELGLLLDSQMGNDKKGE
jgi:hypothetical protein